VRWAGFDKRPGDTAGEDQSNRGPKISININLAAAAAGQKLIDIAPSDVIIDNKEE
jgi:hypothetical protein